MFGLQGTEKPTQIGLTTCISSGKGTSGPCVSRVSPGAADVKNPGSFGHLCSVPSRPYPTPQLWEEPLVATEVHVRQGECAGLLRLSLTAEKVPLATHLSKTLSKSHWLQWALPVKGQCSCRKCYNSWFRQKGECNQGSWTSHRIIGGLEEGT